MTELTLNWTHILIIPGMLLGFTIHELGHALTAYYLGDSSQVEKGNITLNPFKHLSYFGSLAFLLTGYFGWPKALHVDPKQLKHHHRDLFWVALSGPIASLTLCLSALLLTLITAALILVLSDATSEQVLDLLFPFGTNTPQDFNLQALTIAFTGYIFISSFWLTVTSLMPLPGFDGFTVISSLVVLFKQQQKAKKQAQTTLRKNPMTINAAEQRNKVATIHFNAGAAFHDAGQYDDAIARYRQLLKGDVNFGPAYINLGLAYLAKGRRKEAIQAFRGAIAYASDQRSTAEAWQQLHALSEVTPTDEDIAQKSMAEMGEVPWTDTHARPNWVALAFGTGLLSLSFIIIYIYLITSLIRTLG